MLQSLLFSSETDGGHFLDSEQQFQQQLKLKLEFQSNSWILEGPKAIWKKKKIGSSQANRV